MICRKYNWFLPLLLLTLVQCASVKSPDGGPKDRTKPELLSSKPTGQQRDFNDKSITLEYSEDVVEAQTKIPFLSPLTPVSVVSTGRRIKISPDSGWKENTTYHLNLTGKIKDEHEGNLAKDTSLLFSTGLNLDTNQLEIQVLNVHQQTAKGLWISRFENGREPVLWGKTDSLKPMLIKGLAPKKYELSSFLDKNENQQYEEEDGPLYIDTVDINQTRYLKIQALPQRFKRPKLFVLRKMDTLSIESDIAIYPDPVWKKDMVAQASDRKTFWLYPIRKDLIFTYADSLNSCYEDSLLLSRIDSTRSLTIPDFKQEQKIIKQGKQLIINWKYNWKTKHEPDSISFTQDSVWKKSILQKQDRQLSIQVNALKPGLLKIRFDSLVFYNQKVIYRDSLNISQKDFDPPGLVAGTVESPYSNSIIELINPEKQVVASQKGNKFNFLVKPGKYTLQVFDDRDQTGNYTGGNKKARQKAEPLYQHPQTIELKPGWDLENISIRIIP
jgi:hypothetical protein